MDKVIDLAGPTDQLAEQVKNMRPGGGGVVPSRPTRPMPAQEDATPPLAREQHKSTALAGGAPAPGIHRERASGKSLRSPFDVEGEAADGGGRFTSRTKPLAVNPNDLVEAKGRYQAAFGTGGLQFAKSLLETLPPEDQLFYFKFAENTGARLEDVAVEVAAARELWKVSEKSIAALRYAVEDQAERLSELVDRQEALFNTMGRQLTSANKAFDDSTDAVLTRVAQGLGLFEERAGDIERMADDAVTLLTAKLDPKKVAEEATEKASAAAAVVFYTKLSQEIRVIAKAEARKQVDKEWFKRGWVINTAWLMASLGTFLVGYGIGRL